MTVRTSKIRKTHQTHTTHTEDAMIDATGCRVNERMHLIGQHINITATDRSCFLRPTDRPFSHSGYTSDSWSDESALPSPKG